MFYRVVDSIFVFLEFLIRFKTDETHYNNNNIKISSLPCWKRDQEINFINYSLHKCEILTVSNIIVYFICYYGLL